jgi:long-chain acyl-CoA synthetase
MSAEPTSLPGWLLLHARERPQQVAMRYKRRGIWLEITWAEYAERVARVAAGLRTLGVEPGDRVAIHAENRPEWLLADLAAEGMGAVSVGIYPTSPAAEVEYLLGHSEAKVLIAEDEEQLDKTLAVRERLPELRALVVMDDRGVRDGGVPALRFEELEQRAGPDARADLERSVAALDPHAPAVMVYTSGTTGPAKGAMLAHRNLVAGTRTFRSVFGTTDRDELLSYLPLCHVAERLGSQISALGTAQVVNFGEGAETFNEDLREVQPTAFLAVPRVWEKLLAGVEIRIADASPLKRFLYRFWLRQGRRSAGRRMRGRPTPVDRALFALGELMLYRPLRERMGLARVRVAIAGGAPVSPEVLAWLWAIGVPVREGYGQTENTAICCWMPVGDVRLGTVGSAVEDVEVRIAADGEILIRSPGTFLGYFKDPEATEAAIDADGWLHSGDVGELDADGFLKVTDRKKDIIITSGGKNVSPSEVENRLKVSPYIREAVVVGDGRKYLTALIGIEYDTVGDWASRRNVAYTTYADLSSKPEVRKLIEGCVREANESFAHVEQVKRFALLPKELDHEDGELTATQKVKRRTFEDQFRREIEELYA